MENPFSLYNKTILVTGASSGIGRSISIECSKMGGRMFITGRNKERLNETLSLLYGEGHAALTADINNEEDIFSLCTQVEALDAVVHNAGMSKRSLCKNIEMGDFNVMVTNFNGPVLLQKALLEHKKINKGASIVFMASRAANAPSIGNAIYSASKGALISYAKVLALELAPRKIRVNCISPAMVWTDLITSDGSVSKEEFEEAQSKYPLKRFGNPEDIAYLTIYLLSNASNWMTGSCIDITGGGEGTLV